MSSDATDTNRKQRNTKPYPHDTLLYKLALKCCTGFNVVVFLIIYILLALQVVKVNIFFSLITEYIFLFYNGYKTTEEYYHLTSKGSEGMIVGMCQAREGQCSFSGALTLENRKMACSVHLSYAPTLNVGLLKIIEVCLDAHQITPAYFGFTSLLASAIQYSGMSGNKNPV